MKEITSLNKKDEIDLIKDRMKDTIKYYEELEKNYMFLFKNITEFKDLEFQKTIQSLLKKKIKKMKYFLIIKFMKMKKIRMKF